MSNRNKNLMQREQEFADRVNEIGKFEYIEGYSNIKGNVKVLHKKCGCVTTMRAYAVAYSDIDKCVECGRQIREYRKCKSYIEKINPDIVVLSREKDATGKNRYFVACKECGDTFSISFDVLKEGGFKCCSEGVGAYERASEYKAKEIYNELKKDGFRLSYDELVKYIYKEVEKDVYLTVYKGLYDIDKLTLNIMAYIAKRKDKERIAVCSECGELKSGTAGWGRRNANYNSKICVECAKKPRKCSVCGKEKRTNTYAVGKNGKYLDICSRCHTTMKK